MAYHNGNGDCFVAQGSTFGVVPEVPAAMQAGTKARLSHDLKPVIAGIAYARIRILGYDDTVGNVASTIFGEMVENWQLGKIDVVTCLDHI